MPRYLLNMNDKSFIIRGEWGSGIPEVVDGAPVAAQVQLAPSRRQRTIIRS